MHSWFILPLHEKLKFINIFFKIFTKTHHDFWRLFNFISSPGTAFNTEVLDEVIIEVKLEFVLFVLAYVFVCHRPKLHFKNWRIKIPLMSREFGHNQLILSMIDYCLLISIIIYSRCWFLFSHCRLLCSSRSKCFSTRYITIAYCF